MDRYEAIYRDLKRYEEPLVDLIDAYGDFLKVKASFLSPRVFIGRDCLNAPGARILFNPEYRRDPSRFPFITKELDKESFEPDDLASILEEHPTGMLVEHF